MQNNAQMLTSTHMPVFVKKHHEVFLAAGLGIVSSFNIGQNQTYSILRGHWGKKLKEKTSLNPILPRQSLKNKIIEGTLLSANPKISLLKQVQTILIVFKFTKCLIFN